MRIRAIRKMLKQHGKKGIWIAQLHREVNALLKERKMDPIRRQTIGYLLYGYERSYVGKDGRKTKERAGGYLLGEIEIVGAQGNNFLIRHREGRKARIGGVVRGRGTRCLNRWGRTSKGHRPVVSVARSI